MDPLLSSTIDFERYLKESVQSATSLSPKSLRQPAKTSTQDGMGIAEEERQKSFHAVVHRNQQLLTRCLGAWKRSSTMDKNRREIQAEHGERTHMIQKLMSNLSMQSQPVPTASTKRSTSRNHNVVSHTNTTNNNRHSNNVRHETRVKETMNDGIVTAGAGLMIHSRNSKAEQQQQQRAGSATTRAYRTQVQGHGQGMSSEMTHSKLIDQQQQQQQHQQQQQKEEWTKGKPRISEGLGKRSPTNGAMGKEWDGNFLAYSDSDDEQDGDDSDGDEVNVLQIRANQEMYAHPPRFRESPHKSPLRSSPHKSPLRSSPLNRSPHHYYQEDEGNASPEPQPASPPPPAYSIHSFPSQPYDKVPDQNIGTGLGLGTGGTGGTAVGRGIGRGSGTASSKPTSTVGTNNNMTSVGTRSNVPPSRSGTLPVRAASASRQTRSTITTTNNSGNTVTSISASTRTRASALRNGSDQIVSTTVRSSSTSSATRRRPPTHPLTQPSQTTVTTTTTTATTTPRNDYETVSASIPNTITSTSTTINNHTGQSVFLQTMDERALERRKRSLELRKKAEENVKSQQEARHQLLWEKERQETMALEKLKADKRAETMELRHASEAVRDHTVQAQVYLRGLLKKADRFRYLQLIVRWGFAPWRRLVEQKRLDLVKAWQFRVDRLRLWAWGLLVGHTIAQRTARIRQEFRQSAVAYAHYRQKLVRQSWKRWSLHRKMLRAKAKAIRGQFSHVTAQKRAFTSWKLALERVHRKVAQQLRAVAPRGRKSVLRHSWLRWRAFMDAERIDQEVRHRSAATWFKVQEWLKEGV